MTRKYIDKKSALHFRLVQKSVRDQINGESVSERSFAPMNDAAAHKIAEMNGTFEPKVEDEDLDTEINLQHPSESMPEAGEAAKYGIYFDDSSYDYTRHLRRIGEAPDAIFIPATSGSADANETIEEEALAPDYATGNDFQDSDIDPAVKEALDALEDEAFEDEDFEDDFVVKLNREEAAVLCPVDYSAYREKNEDAFIDVEEDSDDDSRSDTGSLRGTAYAASLAITSINNKFDAILKMYDGEDDLEDVDLEEDEDSLDEEEVEDAMQEALDEFLTQQNEYIRPSVAERKQGAISLLEDLRREMGNPTRAVLDREVSETDEELDVEGSEEESDHFDCQSIATQFNNTENLPNIIREATKKPVSIIRLSRRTGMPIEDEHNNSNTEKDHPEIPKENKGQPRSRDETAEEKKARKAAIKTERRENRVQKKEMKVRFKLNEAETARSRS